MVYVLGVTTTTSGPSTSPQGATTQAGKYEATGHVIYPCL